MPRDVETEVDAWRDRRLARRRAAEAARAAVAAEQTVDEPTRPRKRRWFARGR
jgi:hypothetical protein